MMTLATRRSIATKLAATTPAPLFVLHGAHTTSAKMVRTRPIARFHRPQRRIPPRGPAARALPLACERARAPRSEKKTP